MDLRFPFCDTMTRATAGRALQISHSWFGIFSILHQEPRNAMLQLEELHTGHLTEENDSRVRGVSDSLGNYPDAATAADRSGLLTERLLVSLGRNMA